MKNKVLKRTLAVALALTLVSGAPAAVRGGKGIFPPAITANAVTKNIEVGAVFELYDTIDFGEEGAYIIYDDSEPDCIEKFTGEGYIYSSSYLDLSNRYAFHNKSNTIYNRTIYVTSDDIGKYVALKVDSGNGTEEDPFKFTLVESSPCVELNYVNVALDDDISLKYYADKKDVDAANVASVTLDGPNGDITIEKSNFKSVTYNKKNCYVFSYPLYATQFDENVSISFYNSDNEAIKINRKHDSYSYKVNSYLNQLLADTGDYSFKTKKAAKSLSNLGLASQNYFGGTNTINFIDETEAVKTDLAAFNADFDAKLSLVLDSKLSARLYIDGLTDDVASQKYDDYPRYFSVTGQGGKACFELNNIDPTDLGNTYHIKYNDVQYDFSPLSYCARAINNTTNPNSPVIAQAVYEYYKYIKNYATPYNLNKTLTLHNTAPENSASSAMVIQYEEGMTWEEFISDSSLNSNRLINEDGYLAKVGVLVGLFYIYKDGNKIPVTDTIDENGYYTYYYNLDER